MAQPATTLTAAQMRWRRRYASFPTPREAARCAAKGCPMREKATVPAVSVAKTAAATMSASGVRSVHAA